MTASKSVEKRAKAQNQGAEILERAEKGEVFFATQKEVDQLNTFNEKITIEHLINTAILGIRAITAKSKKKSIYQITEGVVDKINKGIEAYEKKRIKEKMKAKAKA